MTIRYEYSFIQIRQSVVFPRMSATADQPLVLSFRDEEHEMSRVAGEVMIRLRSREFGTVDQIPVANVMFAREKGAYEVGANVNREGEPMWKEPAPDGLDERFVAADELEDEEDDTPQPFDEEEEPLVPGEGRVTAMLPEPPQATDDARDTPEVKVPVVTHAPPVAESFRPKTGYHRRK